VILLDASVLVASEDLDDKAHADAVALLETGLTHALDLTIYEVTNICDLVWRRPESGRRLRGAISAMEGVGNLQRVDTAVMDRVAEIVAEYRITAYDAAYVAAAERGDLILVSCDIRDLVSKGLAVTPAAMLEQLSDAHADADAGADD
jgi:predicted nucleic acid-binding protein